MMKQMMRSVVLRQPNELALEERPVPVPGAEEVLIRVKAASICHTDFATLHGDFAGCKYPTVLGHEFSGVVEQCGREVGHVQPGDRVTVFGFFYCGSCSACARGQITACRNIRAIPFQLDGAFQEMVCVPGPMVYSFSEHLSFAEAALTEPAANSYAATDRGNIQSGERVVIIGPGPIGLLALEVAQRKQPSQLIMLGTRRERLEMAQRLGASHVINVCETDPYQAVMEITEGQGADVVLFCGGGEDAWLLAGKILAAYGRLVIEALPPTSEAHWPVRVFDFTAKYVSYLGISGYTAEDFVATLKLMEKGELNTAALVTHRFALEDYQEAFATCAERKGGAIKVIFEMNQE